MRNNIYTISNAMKPHETSIWGYCFTSYENSTKKDATSKRYDTPSKHKKIQALETSFVVYIMWQSRKQ
jgi:hypothetical protein